MDSLFKRFQCDVCGAQSEQLQADEGADPSLPVGWRRLDLTVRMAGVEAQHCGHACSPSCAATLTHRWLSVPNVGPHDMFLEA